MHRDRKIKLEHSLTIMPIKTMQNIPFCDICISYLIQKVYYELYLCLSAIKRYEETQCGLLSVHSATGDDN